MTRSFKALYVTTQISAGLELLDTSFRVLSIQPTGSGGAWGPCFGGRGRGIPVMQARMAELHSIPCLLHQHPLPICSLSTHLDLSSCKCTLSGIHSPLASLPSHRLATTTVGGCALSSCSNNSVVLPRFLPAVYLKSGCPGMYSSYPGI